MKGYYTANSHGTIRKGCKKMSFFKAFKVEIITFVNNLKGKNTEYYKENKK